MEIGVKTILDLVPLLGGRKEQKIRMKPGSTAADLVDSLIRMYGQALEDRLFGPSHRPKPGIAMFVNGRNLFALEGFQTRLNPGDEFLIFPPVAGG